METDKDNIRHMIETELIISVSKIVNLVKSYTTYQRIYILDRGGLCL